MMNQTLNLSPISTRGRTNNIVIDQLPESILDLSLYDENYPSFYIHYIKGLITEEMISEFINKLNIGYISKIDLFDVIKKDGKCYQKAIICFTKWSWNKQACTIREKLIKNREYKYKDENFRFKFKLGYNTSITRLPPISSISQMEKEDVEFYKNYCNHYKKRKIFTFNEEK